MSSRHGGGAARPPKAPPTATAAAVAGGSSAAGPSGRNTGAASVAISEVQQALSRAGLVAVLDLCVALYKFVNVELHSQGWYAVRVRVVPGPDAVCKAHVVLQSHQEQQQQLAAAAAAAAAGAGSVSTAPAGLVRVAAGRLEAM
ncbi:hypothetical protein VOLCADRAFT_117841, partial [Volvox carteri f. nagariensis]